MLSRRHALGALLGVAAAPHIWIPKPAYAQQCTGRGGVKHLIYIRLNGGFRFTTAFNGAVSQEFNPFGLASNVAPGTDWGVSKLLEGADWLDDPNGGQALKDLGMRRVTEFTNEMMVMATVDHEPKAGNADGNHGSGLERFNTGYMGGQNSIFTMMHYGLRTRIATAAAEGRVELPPFVLGGGGMALGFGKYAAFRPPLVQGDNFDNFAFTGSAKLPAWANTLIKETDLNMRDRLVKPNQTPIEAYIGTRESTERYAQIFNDDVLRIGDNSDTAVDGITNRELRALFGDDGSARRVCLALRLFHFGCPAVYLDQGGYDMHSDEDDNLPREMSGLNRILSALNVALKKMQHPSGGSYWDHTLVVMGSEFGRTARGNGFNSAGGSDHGGDRATRWMSMPFMGGLVTQMGLGGMQVGSTEPKELKDDGVVHSYRSVTKTLMDLLCADHSEFFPDDPPITTIF